MPTAQRQPPTSLGGDPASWPAGRPASLVSKLRQPHKPQPLTREERIRRFNVDCGDNLTWSAGWEPGGDYGKCLTVKNASNTVLQLQYKLPETKFFSMAFPEPIQLMPGLSTTLWVHFRPIHLEEYEDCIEFTTDKGVFVVPVRARIPKIRSTIPANLDFGFCPVRDTKTETFEVSNDGDVDISFSWTWEGPFTLAPRAAKVPAGGAVTMTATFHPTSAHVYVANCVCNVPGHTAQIMKIGGIGKFPFLMATSEEISFGRVLTGQSKTEHFKLRNTSLVYAHFEIVRAENDVEPVFAVQPTSGVIPPDGELTVGVLYSPKVTGTFSCDHYYVRTPGGNTVPISFSGEAVGPEITVSDSVLDFGDVPIELPAKLSSRHLEILNHSDVPVPFQMYGIEANGLFKLGGQETSGTLLPRQPHHVRFTFSPDEPGNYYRRVFLLFLNARPMAVDLIGSGYNEKRRPLPMKPHFVSEYLGREARGLHRLTPDELLRRDEARMASAGELDDGADAGGGLSVDFELPPADDEPIEPELELMRGLFRGSSWQGGAVYLEEDRVDFGAGSRLRPSEPKPIRLTNRTAGKLTVQWVVPQGYMHASPKDRSAPVFVVSPMQCDLPPHSSAVFKVQFRPQSDQQYYVQNLECICAFKSQRTFRLVSERNFALPWCLSLTSVGHSFPPAAEQFIARGSLSHRLLTFPAVIVGDTAYQTISITNSNDTPMCFKLNQDLGTTFKVVPPIGLVAPNSTQLLAVRFSPTEAKQSSKTVSFTLNNQPGADANLVIVGTGCLASLDMRSKVFLPTACIGASSSSRMTLRNPSRLALAFEWDIPERFASQISIDRPVGVLRANQSVEVTWTFSPSAAKEVIMKIPCLISAVADNGSSAGEVVRQVCTLSGVGSVGALSAQPSVVKFGTILVGGVHRRTLTLTNSSAVDLFYQLSFRVLSRTGGEAKDAKALEELITCDRLSGLVPARNTVDVQCIMAPFQREAYEFGVSCVLRPGKSTGLGESVGGMSESVLGDPVELCQITASADYPLLKVVDARLSGIAQELLWKQLRLPELNEHLLGVVSDAEAAALSDDAAAAGSEGVSASSSLPTVDMMLPPGLPGQPPTVLHLLVRNVGGVDANFQLRYPTEMELQIEHWADKGEPSATELKHHLIVDKHILHMAPKAAALAPGEEVELRLTMRHMRADDYELPILLQIVSGRQLVLNVQGRTLAMGERYLHLPLREIALPPTPIGLRSPQRHVFELPNYSDVPLQFKVDLSHMNKLNEANFGFPVLVCEDPTGIIAPGDVAYVRVLFHPLEAKDYHVPLPVSIGGAGVFTLVLLASGYDSKEPEQYDKFLKGQEALMPPTQQLALPQLPLRLSCDRALFGVVPMGSTARKLFTIRNVSDVPCDYAWDTSHPSWGHALSIYPSQGTLEPGQHHCCKLNLIAIGPAEELHTSLACIIRPSRSAMGASETEPQLTVASGAESLLPPSHPLAQGTSLRPRTIARPSVAEVQPKLRGLQALLHIEERESRRQAAAAGFTAEEYARTSQVSLSTVATSQPNGTMQMSGMPSALRLLLDVSGCISPPASIDHGASVPGDSAATASQSEMRASISAIVDNVLKEVAESPAVTRAAAAVGETSVPLFASMAAATERPAEKRVDPAIAQDTIRNASEFQALATDVLEGTLFNLVSEVSFGEFALDAVPRQVVRSLEASAEHP